MEALLYPKSSCGEKLATAGSVSGRSSTSSQASSLRLRNAERRAKLQAEQEAEEERNKLQEQEQILKAEYERKLMQMRQNLRKKLNRTSNSIIFISIINKQPMVPSVKIVLGKYSRPKFGWVGLSKKSANEAMYNESLSPLLP